MSAFIVTVETIHEVVAYMLDAGENEHCPRTCVQRLADGTRIGQRLLALNCKAVDDRYNKENDPPKGRQTTAARESSPGRTQSAWLSRGTSYTYVERVRLPGRKTQCQTLKAFHCFLYQCTEGDVPSTTLYKEVKRLSEEIASGIATGLPEYDAADWDVRPSTFQETAGLRRIY